MSIFDGKKKTPIEEKLTLTAFEEELAQKMAKAGILQEVDRFIAEEAAQKPWMTQCQSYYESCQRTVKIHEDLISVIWKETKVETTASGNRVTIIDEDNESVFHYTDYGYMPLHSFVNEAGNEVVTLDQILYLWGLIVQEHMKAALPQCTFGTVYQSIGEASFTYAVPGKKWADWF